MKRLFFILSLVCLAISGWAGQISREQALRQAQTFFHKKGISRALIAADTPLSRRRAQGALQDYYAFNAGQNEGFVIISGDDRTVPVLGYAEHGSFDIDNLPPALADLLNHYAEQIEDIRNGAPVQTRRASHLKVPEFMTVKWNQTDPYNGKTPLGYYKDRKDGVHTVTGCVATAMAQVLYHQHYVDVTQSEIAGYKNLTSYRTSSGTVVDLYVPTIPMGSSLDWANMVDSYNGSESQTQKDAVADLMLYCGAAVKMNYRLAENGGSTASISSVPEAFKRYFGYSKGVRHISRSAYSDTEWDDMIYKEVSVGHPVIYQGLTAKNAGHAFILHGCDSDGKYAVNWGWGGNLDGYFTLDNLTTKQGGYNYSQEAVVYITNDSFSETVKVAVTAIKVDGFNTDKNGALIMPAKTEYSAVRDSWGRAPFSMAITFKSALANFYTIDCGYGIHNLNGQLIGNVLKMRTAEFKNGTGWTFGTGNSAFGGDLSVGTYYIKGYSKQSTASDWLLCDDADKFAVKIDVTDSNMSFSVVDISSLNPDPGPEVTDADRTALAASYSELQTYTEKKQAEATANEKLIADLSVAIVDMKTTASAIEEAISAINAKLANDTYLSESQKNEFLTQLASLSDQLSQQNNELAKVIAELNSIESDNIAVKTQIADLLSQIASQSAIIASITTKEDYIASQALADQLTTTANAIDVASLATRISVVENYLKDLSFTNIQSGLSDLGQTVDQSIADAVAAAEAAEQAEKEKAEFEAAKADMTAIISNIISAASDKVSAIDENNKSIAELKDALKAASDAAAPVSEQIDAIKALLEDKYVTEAQKEENLALLEKHEKELQTYMSSVAEISEQIETIEKSNADQIAQLQDIVKSISELSTDLDAATKKEDIEDLKLRAAVIENSLKDVDPATVSTAVETLADDLKKLSLGEIQDHLSDLEKAIQALIDTAKAEEEATEQAEKEKAELEAAKASMNVRIDAISKVVSDIAADIDDNNNMIADLKKAYEIASEAAQIVKDKIDAIKALLEDKYISEAQKNENLQLLEKYEKELEEYLKSLADIYKQLEAIATSNAALSTELENIKQATAKLSSEVEAATTKDQIEALGIDADAIEVKVKDIDVSSVKTDIAAVAVKMKALSLDDTSTALSKLQDTIQTLIDTAKSDEEKQKEEAEELAKAQESYKSVAEKLDEVIKTHQEIYVILEDAHADFVAKMKEIEVVLAALKQQYADIEKMLEELIAKQPSTRADEDPIEMLQERLKQLADNIATLESQYQQVSDMIAQLEDQLKQYATLIETASATRDQLQNDLTSAVTAADVDLLTVSASNLANQLATDGKSNYEQFVESYDTVLENLNTYIGNINTVYTQANNLETDVAYETTSIQRVAIDESEVLGRYDLKGNRVDSTYKGMQIIRLKNGKTIKINVK